MRAKAAPLQALGHRASRQRATPFDPFDDENKDDWAYSPIPLEAADSPGKAVPGRKP
jgi:hypothetical protein